MIRSIAFSMASVTLLIASSSHASLSMSEAREIVSLSLRANATATTYEEWRTSGLHSTDIFSRLIERSKNSNADRQNLCSALNEMAPDDLAIFQNEIEDPTLSAGQLPCVSSLRKRIKAYYLGKQIELSLAAIGSGTKVSKQNGPVKTEEIAIDVDSSPILFDGGLRHGEIALTFDDGPHPTRTDRLLSILSDFDAKATFFEVGKNAAQYAEITKRVRAAGHTVGSHSHDHANLPALSTASASHNIDQGAKEVSEALGLPAHFFRFPFGARTKSLQAHAKGEGLATFFWNIDTLDWKYRNPSVLLPYAIKELDAAGGKGIVLFHDIQEQTIVIIRDFIAELRERGYTFVRFVDPKQEEAAREVRP